jgi:endonuclease/exonuclease/phosphatase (EEP) superfamily protein YafD
MQASTVIYSQCKPEQTITAESISSKSVVNGQHLDPDNISLLNWNIYKSNRENWAKDLHDFIKEQDIVTIQEAHLNDKLQALLAKHNYHWTLNAAFHVRNKPSGVMTASRITALNTCGLRHIEPIIRTPKTTLVSYYPIEDTRQILLVANIHGINFTLGTSAYKRQIEQLFQIATKHNGPVIIAGDFNTWSQARMSILKRHAKSANLSSLNYSNHIRTQFLGNALDHVFYRGLKPLEHHSWKVDSSDHNPTSVKFKLL